MEGEGGNHYLLTSDKSPLYLYGVFLFSPKELTPLAYLQPVPVAARSKAYVCGRSTAEIVCSNPTGGHGCLSCDCCVLSGRGLCDELITRPEEFY